MLKPNIAARFQRQRPSVLHRSGSHRYSLLGIGITAIGLLAGLTAEPSRAANPQLQIGIVQRFGEKSTDRIVLEAPPGDQLTLKFKSQEQVQTLQTPKVELQIQPRPLEQPQTTERIVISRHRSFESAEASAQAWQAKGVAVEIAQPGGWEVWANRQQYDNPISRYLLLQTLKANGVQQPQVESQNWTEVPQASWVVNGYRYNRNQLEITAAKNLIRVNQNLYAGSLRLQPNAYRSYTLVNQVPVETYLRGVVPHEIGPEAPAAAVEAQAVIARTYALRNLRRFRIDNYELCADTQCQVYRGLEGTNPVADRAIAATAGQVLTYNNELIDALYSSTTGGVTAPFQDVWEGASRPYLKARIDAAPNQVWSLPQRSLAEEQNFQAFINLKQGFNEVGWQQFRWREESTLPEITQTLKTYLQKQRHPLASFQTIRQIAVSKRSAAGRVQQIAVTTDRGPVILAKDEIIRAFDPPRSLLFYLQPLYQPDGKTLKGYAFIGGGLGHGVGLSQTGSYRLAEMGWSAAEILQFYYPGTRLQSLSPAIANQPSLGAVPAPPTPFNPFKFSALGFHFENLLEWLP